MNCIISSNGVGSLKIGMSKMDVEGEIGGTLKPYAAPKAVGMQDSVAHACDSCSESFTCHYEGADFILTFFRFTMYIKSDFQLASIVSTSPSVKTKDGIHIGLTDTAFLEICKKNKYSFSEMDIDEKNKGYLFTENQDSLSSKMLIIRVSSGIISSLMAVNMIGD